jgi:hypothetical protein
MRHFRYLPLVALLLCACIPPTFADQVVYFVNGKAIMVKSVEKGEKFTILEMDGGGRIGVPTDQISKIEDFAVSQPVLAPGPAPDTSPQVVSAVVPPLPVRPASPSTPISPTSMTPGPGIGGRPAPGAAQSITGVRPIEIGESGPPVVGQRSLSRPGMANRGLGAPAMVPTGSGRANLAAGRRPGAGGRGMGNVRGAGRLAELNPGAPAPGAPGAAQSGAVTPPGAPPVAPSPTVANAPEEPPPSPDDSDEQPYDPSAPEEDDSSGGNNPGGPS